MNCPRYVYAAGMPLSSSSGPSLGASSSDTIAAPSCSSAACESVSLAPKSAGGRARNMRPNRPLKNRELGARLSPRTATPCGLGLATVVNPLVSRDTSRDQRCALQWHAGASPVHRLVAVLAHSAALPHVCH